MPKDPVCGMEIAEAEAAGKSEYKGKSYYFCAPGCKKAFDKDPQQYVVQLPNHRASSSTDEERSGSTEGR